MNSKKTTKIITRNAPTILKCGIASLLAAFSINSGEASPSVTASGTSTTGSGVVHACTGGTVTLSVTGMTTTPPSGCCGNDSGASWAYDSTTYSWSGDASGSSPTATLSTGSEGTKTASVALTHKFKCSVGTATTTTNESASLASGIKIVTNDTQGCTPPTLNGGNSVGVPGTQNVSNNLTESTVTGLFLTRKWFTGTWSNRQGTESYTATGGVLQKGCGLDLNETKTYSSGTVGFKYKLFSFTYSFGGGSANALLAKEEFKKIYYQWYEYRVNASTGDFNGTCDVVTTSSGIVISSLSSVPATGSYAMTGSGQPMSYAASTCKVSCCTSN